MPRVLLGQDGGDGLSEEALLAGFNEVQRQRGRPPLASLAKLLRGAAAFVTCLPLPDPYAAVRAQPALGPLRPLPAPAEGPPETGYFAYLAVDYRGTAAALADAAQPPTALAADVLARQVAADGPHHGLERIVAACLGLLRPDAGP